MSKQKKSKGQELKDRIRGQYPAFVKKCEKTMCPGCALKGVKCFDLLPVTTLGERCPYFAVKADDNDDIPTIG
ncbi:MAG: hypothetical protein MUO99_05125 [Dehalococcoidales bacterium]|nr:hypothetical protein [Dehalococcoidales bacterium]